MILSTGEATFSGFAAEPGGNVRAGAKVRLADVNAEVQGGSAFETVGSMDLSHFAADVYAGLERQHGAAGVAWIEHLISLDGRHVRETIARRRDVWMLCHVGDLPNSQISTVARRFALCAGAAEEAIATGILPLAAGEADEAIGRAWASWLATADTVQMEEAETVERLKVWMLQNGSRFEQVRPDEQAEGGESVAWSGSRRPGEMAGWIRTDRDGKREAFILPPAFREACGGVDAKLAARLLERSGLLRRGGDADGRLTVRARLPDRPGQFLRGYCVDLDELGTRG